MSSPPTTGKDIVVFFGRLSGFFSVRLLTPIRMTLSLLSAAISTKLATNNHHVNGNC